MTRTRMTLSAVALAGLVTLTGCGTPAVDLAAETSALSAAALDDPAPSAAPSSAAPSSAAGSSAAAPPAAHRAKAPRAYLRKNTLHGEIVVQSKAGPQTIVVQRGTVTATDTKTVSVKSSDGFTQTWTKGPKIKVRGDLKTGAEVGVAGRKDGTTTTARLVVVKK